MSAFAGLTVESFTDNGITYDVISIGHGPTFRRHATIQSHSNGCTVIPRSGVIENFPSWRDAFMYVMGLSE